jgi:hypothetical protein
MRRWRQATVPVAPCWIRAARSGVSISMARQPKRKSPYEVGKDVWVKAKVTRVAPYSEQMPDLTMITVELPSGHRDTMGLNEDKIRPADEA